MTLNDFWKSKKQLAINCKTEEQAKIFCMVSHTLDETWCDGTYYLDKDYWKVYKEKTCYYNDGTYGINEGEEGVLNFDDIDWDTSIMLYIRNGKDSQINMVIEEMSELTKELLKDKRGKNNRNEIVEELADVLFTLNYVKIAFDIKQEEIDEVLKKKGLKL